MGNYPAQITHTGEEVKGLRSVPGGEEQRWRGGGAGGGGRQSGEIKGKHKLKQ